MKIKEAITLFEAIAKDSPLGEETQVVMAVGGADTLEIESLELGYRYGQKETVVAIKPKCN